MKINLFMSSLVEKLERIEFLKKEIQQEELLVQKELEKKSELDLDDKIMPNNISIIHHQMEKDFQKELNMMIKLQNDGVLYGDELKKIKQELREKEISIRERNGKNSGRNRNGYLVLNKNEKLITFREFLDNLNKVDSETIETIKTRKKELVEIQPKECMIYFSKIIGIIKHQQEEINQLKLIIESK